MKITGLHENPEILGGRTIIELEFEPSEGNAVEFPGLGAILSEPYDEKRLWAYSQIELARTLEDIAFWNVVSNGLVAGGIENAPSGQELQEMARQRFTEGNVEGFAGRLN